MRCERESARRRRERERKREKKEKMEQKERRGSEGEEEEGTLYGASYDKKERERQILRINMDKRNVP